MNRAVVSLVVALGLGTPGALRAAQAECDEPIDNLAKIGYPGRLTLSITEDDDNKECRFSIEGVATGSPPQEQLDEAIRNLRSQRSFGGQGAFSSATLSQSVPVLLAAASPVDSAEPELLDSVFLSAAEACFNLITSNFPGSSDLFLTNEQSAIELSNFNARCAVAGPDAVGALNDFLGGSVRFLSLTFPVIAFRNERESDLTEYLVIPIAP